MWIYSFTLAYVGAFLAKAASVEMINVTKTGDNGCDILFTGYLQLCYVPTSICKCRSDWKTRNSTYAVVAAGGHRTIAFTTPTFEEYILKPNNYDFDVVYVIPVHGARPSVVKDVVNILERNAVAFIVHASNISETMQAYCKRTGRPYHYNMVMLDKLQARRGRGGIVDMWTQIETAYQILKNLGSALKRRYSMVLKLRPDLVFLTPLLLKNILSNHELLDRPFFNSVNHIGDVSAEMLSKIPKRHVLHPYGYSAFFPSCAHFGGLSDRLFMAPPEYMDVILPAEWLKNLITANASVIEKMEPGLIKFIPFRNGVGVEVYLKQWIEWSRIPVAMLPASTLTANGVTFPGFIWMILRSEHLFNYCEQNFMKSHWTDAHCLHETEKTSRRRIAADFFNNQKEHIKVLCHKYLLGLEPQDILKHRGCTEKDPTVCTYHVIWAIGEPPTWEPFSKLQNSVVFRKYIAGRFSNYTIQETSIISPQ